MSKPVHPVQTLREHITSLEAAITLTLGRARKENVHRLRTYTRRIEAQLELLALTPDLPDFSKPARKIRKLLKALRRAAGGVRDLDVQRKLLKADERSRSRKISKAASELRSTLKDQRTSEVKSLHRLLKRDQKSLAPALEDLVKCLEPAQNLTLSPDQLEELTLSWYLHSTPTQTADETPDALHSIRKSAKLARYLAETGAETLARSFESLQEAGGTWHDLLTLTEISQRHFGKRSLLTKTYAQRQKTALDGYHAALRTHNIRA